jgi:hypothetical protein
MANVDEYSCERWACSRNIRDFSEPLLESCDLVILNEIHHITMHQSDAAALF